MNHYPRTFDRAAVLPPADMSVRFERVRLAYEGAHRYALDGADFEVPGGAMLALVGHAGAGKTSCANLIMRFHEAAEGRILIGGYDIRDLPYALLHDLVAMVPQNVRLLDRSVADNIRIARPGATRAEIERAARIARAHDFIAKLPRGYDTPCDELGQRLSCGERQRIAIAGAVLQDARIVIVDEAYDPLDAGNGSALLAALAEVRRGRTLLVMAHRLSTMSTADRIVVLEHGRVVEEGRHDELLFWNDRYARLIAASGAIR